jgi:hypothetical protein
MKKIIFTNTVSELDDAAIMPSPSLKSLPGWYKKTESFVGGKFTPAEGMPNLTVKKCVPVLDSIGLGYIITLWTDVYVEREGNQTSFQPSIVRTETKPVDGHPIEQQAPLYPVPPGFDRQILKWINPWHIKTPRGYSCFFTTPIHRDLPFQIMEGVVDTDTFPLSVNFPFFLRSDFSGTIPHGTPIAQVIPFKRDNFVSEKGEFDSKKYSSIHNYHDTTFFNRYKNKWWSRKVFK